MRDAPQSSKPLRTQVGIVGAGPSGLLLGRLLELAGVESVIIEARSREYVEQRVRAGLLEQGTVDLLHEIGLDRRLAVEALVHEGFELRFGGVRHHIPVSELTGGRRTFMYGQQEVVKDAIAARVESGAPIVFGIEAVSLDGLDTPVPKIHYTLEGTPHLIRCDFVAGCDGFHGVSRPAIPHARLREYAADYPFAWFGVLAAVAPSTDELIYAAHERGFALHSMRSPELSRFYLQVPPATDLAEWTDDRIWTELRLRLATDDGWRLADGPIVKKDLTLMRSYVAEPMRYGSLFLAGDAAHIVPPTAAKGLNLGAADVQLLADCLVSWYASGDRSALERYSPTALRRVWQAQEFSRSMTALLHHDPDSPFDGRLQHARLDGMSKSRAALTAFCESYVGSPFAGHIHQ
jgi:p-hydroxybenzoate 3-monooxygenase